MSNQHGTLDALCRIPHPLTPREKPLGQIAYDGWAQGLPGCEWDNQTETQKRAWSKAADAILTALASGSGDHAELALNAKAAQTWALGIYENREQAERRSKFIDSDLPDTVLALLAEIAALRGQYELDGHTLQASVDRATEAERKLAEAVGLLRESLSPGSFEGETEINTRIRTFLSKEAERG